MLKTTFPCCKQDAANCPPFLLYIITLHAFVFSLVKKTNMLEEIFPYQTRSTPCPHQEHHLHQKKSDIFLFYSIKHSSFVLPSKPKHYPIPTMWGNM